MLLTVTLFCALSFLGYGVSCLFSPRMVVEFDRYRLRKYRVLTGVLQVLGGAGLLLGILYDPVGMLAAAGLSLLMLAGFITRLKIRDPLLLCLPSLAYMALCAWLTVTSY